MQPIASGQEGCICLQRSRQAHCLALGSARLGCDLRARQASQPTLPGCLWGIESAYRRPDHYHGHHNRWCRKISASARLSWDRRRPDRSCWCWPPATIKTLLVVTQVA